MGHVFVKANPIPGSRSLIAEKAGLELLRRYAANSGLNIPQVHSATENELKIEKIFVHTPTAEQWKTLGRGLARLHRATHSSFGLSEDNFIGLNPQVNTPHNRWGEFFVDRRLRTQIRWIKDTRLRDKIEKAFEAGASALVDYLNLHDPAPSLLHGDLWSGNAMFSKQGPWLIDPAVYYGDRETDIAMTKMFGGFASEFYDAYASEWPMPSGYDRREPIYNLYHYLNHLNLFGDSYLPGVRKGLEAIDAIRRASP